MSEFTPQTNSAEREAVEASAEAVDAAVAVVASKFHEQWRETRLNEDGTFEPRIKSTKDEVWIQAHDGATEVDIANTAYGDLPSDWQQENKDAAHVVVTLIDRLGSDVDLGDPDQRSYVGRRIHDEWLSRENNSYARGGELDVPFDDLSAEEQAKDIDQFATAVDALTK